MKIRSAVKTLPLAIAKKDAILAHEIVRGGAASCLRAAMACARLGEDYVTAKQYLERAAGYADALTDMAQQGLDGTPWSGLYVLYCSLMLGKYDKAEAVARWMTQCAVAENDADAHDPLAMLSGYGVLDMREQFETYRRDRFDTSWHATHPFFGPLSVYFDLWHAILTRDQPVFDVAIGRCGEHHVRLAKQRGEGRLEFGGGEDSRYIVDFMGIGCAIMARRRGMTCDVDTTYLPKAMIESASPACALSLTAKSGISPAARATPLKIALPQSPQDKPCNAANTSCVARSNNRCPVCSSAILRVKVR